MVAINVAMGREMSKMTTDEITESIQLIKQFVILNEKFTGSKVRFEERVEELERCYDVRMKHMHK